MCPKTHLNVQLLKAVVSFLRGGVEGTVEAGVINAARCFVMK